MKMLVTINKASGAFSHPFFAPTIEEATQAMTKINPENLSDLQFHELCEFKDNSDIFRLTLGPKNPTSQTELTSLISENENDLKNLIAIYDSNPNELELLVLEYKIAQLHYARTKYQLDKHTIFSQLPIE